MISRPGHARFVQSYAVYWNEPDGTRFAGRISVDSSGAELEGGGPDGRQARRRIRAADITSLRYERGHLFVRRRNGAPVLIGSVDRPGVLCELRDRLQS